MREDRYFNALQLKYANAITCHKSPREASGNAYSSTTPFWQDDLLPDDLKWLYTAITRGVAKVFFVNFGTTFSSNGLFMMSAPYDVYSVAWN